MRVRVRLIAPTKTKQKRYKTFPVMVSGPYDLLDEAGFRGIPRSSDNPCYAIFYSALQPLVASTFCMHPLVAGMHSRSLSVVFYRNRKHQEYNLCLVARISLALPRDEVNRLFS